QKRGRRRLNARRRLRARPGGGGPARGGGAACRGNEIITLASRVLKSHRSAFPGRTIMKFRPLHDRVVVRRIEADEKTRGGIIIPDSAREKPSECEVIAVGPGARDESGKLVPLDVKPGDRVLFGKWSGTE